MTIGKSFKESAKQIFSRMLRDPALSIFRPSVVRPSIHPSIHPSVRQSHYFFLFFCALWPHCSCPKDQVTSNIALAHPHATGVVVYLALFQFKPFRFYIKMNIPWSESAKEKKLFKKIIRLVVQNCSKILPLCVPKRLQTIFGMKKA